MDMSTVITKNPAKRSLTPRDRCDRCGAQAVVQIGLIAGDLLFCKHHFEQKEPFLGDWVQVLADDRIALAVEERGAAALNQG